jgi:hypothetical protein
MDNDLMVTWNGSLDHDRDEVSLTPWVFTICPGCAVVDAMVRVGLC